MSSNKIDQKLSEMHEALFLAKKALLSFQSRLQKTKSGLLLEFLMVTAKTKKSKLTAKVLYPLLVLRRNVIK